MPRYTVPKDVSGRFPAKHAKGVDPELVGLRAFEHPAVLEWHRWVAEEYEPGSDVLLVTPCSNVKPYTRSPTSAKVRGVLRRLGLWDAATGRPRRLDWVYLSDLLALVPYERAEEYPACCYELHPDDLLSSPRHLATIASVVARALERLAERLDAVVLFLPSKHLMVWEEAEKRASRKPRVVRVKYSIFSVKGLEETLAGLLGRDAPSTTLDRWMR